jgi:serine/threonine-protein kinase
MLAGWVPFSATTPVAALYKQVNEAPPPLRQANISIPSWLEAVVLKALEKSPQDRYRQASDFAQALRQRQAPQAATAPVSRAAPAAAPARKEGRKEGRSRLIPILIGGIVILLIAIVAVVAILLSGDGGPAGPTPFVTRVVPREPASPALLAPDSGDLLAGQSAPHWQVVEDAGARDLLDNWQESRLTHDDGL